MCLVVIRSQINAYSQGNETEKFKGMNKTLDFQGLILLIN